MRLRAPLLLLLLLPLSLARGDVPPDVLSALREGRLAPAEAALALREAGVSPDEARALLATPGSGGAQGRHQATITDAKGRATPLEVVVPSTPPPAAGYAVVIALHGLGGKGKQVLPVATRLAPADAIVLAPSAQYLAPEEENEDMWEVGKDVPQTESDDPKERRKEALRRLVRAARDQVFPHWWSYRDDSFPLQALAWASQRYPIDRDRVVLIGYSMGGYGTWNVGLRYPDRFAGISPMAGGISRKENTGPRDEPSRALLGNARLLPSFFLHGNADPVVPVRFSRTIDAELTELGADHTYIEVEGEGHHLRSFLEGDEDSQRLQEWIAARRRDPHPRRVEHTALGAYHGASYWVRIDALADKTARVEAEVAEGNTIRVRTRGVTSLTLFLDPTLLQVAAPVKVELDGALVHEGPVAASLEAVAESWGSRRDPGLVYERMLRLQVPAAPATSGPRDF